jgi:hypothetical protein
MKQRLTALFKTAEIGSMYYFPLRSSFLFYKKHKSLKSRPSLKRLLGEERVEGIED